MVSSQCHLTHYSSIVFVTAMSTQLVLVTLTVARWQCGRSCDCCCRPERPLTSTTRTCVQRPFVQLSMDRQLSYATSLRLVQSLMQR